MDAEYFRRWRAAHPEYRKRDNAERKRRRRQAGPRRDRSAEYARRNAARRIGLPEPLPELFPDLVRGSALLFREEDLARDLRQEAELARLEGRDPDAAVRSYAARERAWWLYAAPILIDLDDAA